MLYTDTTLESMSKQYLDWHDKTILKDHPFGVTLRLRLTDDTSSIEGILSTFLQFLKEQFVPYEVDYLIRTNQMPLNICWRTHTLYVTDPFTPGFYRYPIGSEFNVITKSVILSYKDKRNEAVLPELLSCICRDFRVKVGVE